MAFDDDEHKLAYERHIFQQYYLIINNYGPRFVLTDDDDKPAPPDLVADIIRTNLNPVVIDDDYWHPVHNGVDSELNPTHPPHNRCWHQPTIHRHNRFDCDN